MYVNNTEQIQHITKPMAWYLGVTCGKDKYMGAAVADQGALPGSDACIYQPLSAVCLN
jgi:hypothetical protein